MTGKNLPRHVRATIDAGLREYGYNDPSWTEDRYEEMLDNLTNEVMMVFWRAD